MFLVFFLNALVFVLLRVGVESMSDHAVLYVYRTCFGYAGLGEVQEFLAGCSRLSPRFDHKQVGRRARTHADKINTVILHCPAMHYAQQITQAQFLQKPRKIAFETF